MDYTDASFVWLAYWGSNLVGLIFLFVSFKWTRVARLMFAILFGWASWVNYSLSLTDPDAYLNYAAQSVGLYADFIQGWFSRHITVFVTAIAGGQLLIAVGMLLKKKLVTIACIGAIIFLMAIAPLGMYAAFPFSITVSGAAFFVAWKDEKEYIWKRRRASTAHLDKRRVAHT